jgi:hypothetical protein
MADLNTRLFQIHLPDKRTSTTDEQEESDDEDMFSRAFQEQVQIGELLG